MITTKTPKSIHRATSYWPLSQAQATQASASSTFRELAGKVQNARVKEAVMTIEQQIRQEGRQEGRREGALIGQIQYSQEVLGLPVSRLDELEQRRPEELEATLRDLKAQLRSRMRS